MSSSAHRARRQGRLLAALIAAVVVVVASHGLAAAKKRYFFDVTHIVASEGVKPEILEHVKSAITEAIAASDDIVGELADAPDPAAKPKAYKAFLRKKKLAAFKVNVEITSYETSLEELPAPRKGNRFAVAVSLRMFGETIPDRVMAFTGDGSASIKLEIGKKLRPRDSLEAHKEAAIQAVGNALASSREKLAAPPPKKSKK